MGAPAVVSEGRRRAGITSAHVGAAYRDQFESVRRERAFLSATAFTGAFAACRLVTHAIRAQVGPIRNLSVRGRHLHHSTPGIITLNLLGDVWVYRFGAGPPIGDRAGSRAAVIAYGIATALTLDEFALWFDLADDYWNAQGRKSIDAAVLFGGLSVIGVAGGGLLRQLPRALAAARREF
jgi:hypothetical protein